MTESSGTEEAQQSVHSRHYSHRLPRVKSPLNGGKDVPIVSVSPAKNENNALKLPLIQSGSGALGFVENDPTELETPRGDKGKSEYKQQEVKNLMIHEHENLQSDNQGEGDEEAHSPSTKTNPDLARAKTLLNSDKYEETKHILRLKQAAVDEEKKRLAEAAAKKRNISRQLTYTPVH